MTNLRVRSGRGPLVLGLQVFLASLTCPLMGQEADPVAKAIPAREVFAYAEWQGLDAHQDAWRKTAASKVLNETTTGAMLREIVTQLAGLIPAEDAGPAPIRPRDAGVMLEHVVRHGMAVALSGGPGGPQQGQGAIVIIRDAGQDEVRAAFVGLLGGRDEGEIADRAIEVMPGEPARGYFVDQGDLVIVIGPAPEAVREGLETVISVLQGDEPSMEDHPARQELVAAGDGFTPVGLAFLDLAPIPLPPQAAQLGLDGLKRIEMQWGLQDEALVSVTRLVAPAPRRGILRALNQPTFQADEIPPLPEGLDGATILSIDWEALLDAAAGVPEIGENLAGVEEQVRRQTGLRLREDILRSFGPRWAFYVKPQTITMPADPWTGLAQFIFHPPKLTALVEVRDREKFTRNLDALMRTLNREIARSIPRGPVPEIVRLREGDGHVLSMPPEIAPLPQGVQPALVLGDGFAALGISPQDARDALHAEGGIQQLQQYGTLPENLIALSFNDPRELVPEFIVNLPFFLQLLGKIGEEEPSSPPGMNRLAKLRIDPELIPEPAAIREHLFPSWTAVSLDDNGLTVQSRESIPSINPLSSGPVLVALLLPAVQAAREAARRAQCVNNLKQIGLAMHNYHDTYNRFPAAAVTAEDGTPLLSWRVAILPYIEEAPLYNEFHLDEPWDSPHNMSLLDRMPAIYACPSNPVASGETSYRVFTGNGAAFDLTRPSGIREFTDGTSNTLLVVESSERVPWTQPEGIPFDPAADPQTSLGSNHPGGINALFADGSVRFLTNSINQVVLKAIITRSGGEVVGEF